MKFVYLNLKMNSTHTVQSFITNSQYSRSHAEERGISLGAFLLLLTAKCISFCYYGQLSIRHCSEIQFTERKEMQKALT